jgi:hypothetical protein
MTDIKIPAEIAARLAQMQTVTELMARKLERAHALWGADQTDDEWTVNVDHDEIERIIANLRAIGEFTGWLAEFGDRGGEQ